MNAWTEANFDHELDTYETLVDAFINSEKPVDLAKVLVQAVKISAYAPETRQSVAQAYSGRTLGIVHSAIRGWVVADNN